MPRSPRRRLPRLHRRGLIEGTNRGLIWLPGEVGILVMDDLAQIEVARKSGYRCSSPLSGLLGPGSTSK